MKITNTTAKVIGIKNKDLMPDASMEILPTDLTPAVSALINMGFLSVDNKEELAEAAKDAAMEAARKQVMDELRAAGKLKEETTEAEQAEETAPKRKARKSSKEAETAAE